MTNQRFLYYVPWSIVDGSTIACGLAYNGVDEKTKKHRFDRIYNIRWQEVEFGTSCSTMMQVNNLFYHNFLVLESLNSFMVEELCLFQDSVGRKETRNNLKFVDIYCFCFLARILSILLCHVLFLCSFR